ncbi:100K [Duck adenovirus 3]|nr:100K [Duck adenovirus 3]
MGINGRDKAKLILELIFKHAIEEGVWSRFVRHMQREAWIGCHIDLGKDFSMLGTAKATDRLILKMGEHRSVLLAYRAEEEVLGMGDAIRKNSTSSSEEEDEVFYTSDHSDTESSVSDENEGPEHDSVETPENEGSEAPVSTETETLEEPTESPQPQAEREEAEETPRETVEPRAEEEVSVPEGTGNQVQDKDEDEAPCAVDELECVPDKDDYQTKYEIPTGPDFKTHLKRMATMVMGALNDKAMPDEKVTVESVQAQLEHFIFNPPREVPPEVKDARHNFYPPFVVPKAISNYHVFTMTAPIPKSCKANRYGTEVFAKLRESNYFRRLPRWRVGVTLEDGLGKDVTPIGELEEEVKLIPLQEDIARMQWVKGRAEHVNYFGYPSLHIPPKLSKMLMEVLIQPFVNEGDEKVKPAIDDYELWEIVDSEHKMSASELSDAMHKRRSMMLMAVRIGCQLELMERVFRNPSMVKKCQECLHHTFHRGYVSMIRDISKVNLSNFVTYHGITYNNPLNNCIMSRLCEGQDKEDFIVDSIYLFLVLTWQTAMGMWSQAIDEGTVKVYSEVFEKLKRQLYALTSVTDMSKAIVDILMDGDRLTEEMQKSIPNFITNSQISNFRSFLMERSNMPSIFAPLYPSDLIPLVFKQCTMALWDQVYLLQVAYFLMNHGGYLWEPEVETGSARSHCPCNLCSPHRMPATNQALHNEILAIGTFEIQNAEGKTFKLTPELWTNAYLEKFEPKDFHPFHALWYEGNESSFTKERTACVTTSPEVFTLIRQIKDAREEFIRTKGRGVYKDPETGEELTDSRAGSLEGPTLPVPVAHKLGGAAPKKILAKPVRAAIHHDPKASGRYEGAGAEGARQIEGGRRLGVHRQRGHLFGGERRGGRGSGRVHHLLRRPATPVPEKRCDTEAAAAEEAETHRSTTYPQPEAEESQICSSGSDGEDL